MPYSRQEEAYLGLPGEKQLPVGKATGWVRCVTLSFLKLQMPPFWNGDQNSQRLLWEANVAIGWKHLAWCLRHSQPSLDDVRVIFLTRWRAERSISKEGEEQEEDTTWVMTAGRKQAMLLVRTGGGAGVWGQWWEAKSHGVKFCRHPGRMGPWMK